MTYYHRESWLLGLRPGDAVEVVHLGERYPAKVVKVGERYIYLDLNPDEHPGLTPLRDGCVYFTRSSGSWYSHQSRIKPPGEA